jgi:hypothetical protein
METKSDNPMPSERRERTKILRDHAPANARELRDSIHLLQQKPQKLTSKTQQRRAGVGYAASALHSRSQLVRNKSTAGNFGFFNYSQALAAHKFTRGTQNPGFSGPPMIAPARRFRAKQAPVPAWKASRGSI